MNFRPLIITAFSGLTILGANAAVPQTGSGETDGYRLVWQDLFDNGELNPERWNIEINGEGGGNAELQFYTDSKRNVHVGDDGEGNGCLILTARREEYNGKYFTSGRVNSLGLTYFKHGKIEASIKMPVTNAGLWPAFWMMGNDYPQVGWPRSGEIDIVEMGHSNGIKNEVSDRFFNGAAHWGQGWPNASHAMDATKAYSLQDGEFHLYTLVWDDDHLYMYVDLDKQPRQTPYFRIDITANEPDNEWSPGNYFHKDNFIIFNLAVGGNFPGIHSPEGITALNEENGNEASMYVNYVKIYQKGEGDESITMSVPGDADPSGVSFAEADNTSWSVTPGFIQAAGASRIALYDLSGKKVAENPGETISTVSLALGLYIARAGNSSRKITLK